jgi:hypothetical protein
MHLPMTACETCEGSRKTPTQRRAPVIDGRADLGRMESNLELDPSRPVGEAETCGSCAGHGVRRADGYGTYRTAKAAQTGRSTGKATPCRPCAGTGTVAWAPVFEDCHSCRGTGEQPVWDPARPYLPEDVEWTRSMPDDVVRAWAADVEIVVVRRAGNLSWGAANLGLGGIWSSTDYGEMAARSDEQVVTSVREQLARHHMQWCKVTDRATRRVATVVAVEIRANGYQPVPVGVEETPLMLPPTYTPEVLNRPSW